MRFAGKNEEFGSRIGEIVESRIVVENEDEAERGTKAVLKDGEGGAPCGHRSALVPFRPVARSPAASYRPAFRVGVLAAAMIGTATMIRAGEVVCAMALLTVVVAFILLSLVES
jgi:hypothetical protein